MTTTTDIDLLCIYVREQAQTRGAIVAVFEAEDAHFSIQVPEDLQLRVAEIFEAMAAHIRRQCPVSSKNDLS